MVAGRHRWVSAAFASRLLPESGDMLIYKSFITAKLAFLGPHDNLSARPKFFSLFMNQTQNLPAESASVKTNIYVLTLGALGVVFGDIGTSPLYAFRECFNPEHGLATSEANILGILSLIFWSLTLVISLKYLTFLMKADNEGEGGILALMALVAHEFKDKKRLPLVIFLGLIGAALLYGDGIITPAISVLSAVEGLNVETKMFEPYVVYISIAILTVLFMFQRKGTASIGAIFGPFMLAWFTTLGLVGLWAVAKEPSVLAALNPYYAVRMFVANEWQGFAVLGSVFLAVTGGEVMYADMGHFGKRPIRMGWFAVAMPGLLLNYFGQGAHLLGHRGEVENLFYRMSPDFLHYPMVFLATSATIIASQAVISGAFSLGRQSLQLGFFPRMRIIHTSSMEIGQVYLPAVNTALFAGTVFLILQFRKSGNLAGAYGIAVSGTMLITTILAIMIAKKLWPAKTWIIATVSVVFLLVNLAFFVACLLKIHYGGWIPVLIGGLIYLMMSTWIHYRDVLGKKILQASFPVDLFIKDIQAHMPFRAKGTAVFLTGNPTGIPRTLLHNFKHNQVLHEQVFLMTVATEDVPFIRDDARSTVEELGAGLFRIHVSYGFCEDPDIPRALRYLSQKEAISIDLSRMTYILGRETLIIKPSSPLWRWRKRLFSFLSKNSFDASTFYRLPPGQVIEYGLQVEL